jgi:hypothetical protein
VTRVKVVVSIKKATTRVRLQCCVMECVLWFLFSPGPSVVVVGAQVHKCDLFAGASSLAFLSMEFTPSSSIVELR